MSLQAGMNYRGPIDTSIFFMSTRANAPYNDRVEDEGRTLIYEGHDVPRSSDNPIPKNLPQEMNLPSGRLTQNGKFFEAAHRFKESGGRADHIRVYQKLRPGIWVFNGTFALRDSWQERSGRRQVFKFKLELDEAIMEPRRDSIPSSEVDLPQSRVIPSDVKLVVYKRDDAQCVLCGATDNLHFDHDYPYSKGGSSLIAENIRLLCARHNLMKGSRIE